MAGHHGDGTQLARHAQQIAKLHRLIATNARYRRVSGQIAIDKLIHHAFFKTRFIIQHIMWHIQHGGDAARIVNILAGTTRAFAANGFAMIVKLQRDADRIISGAFHQSGGDRAIDPTRHGNNHALTGALLARSQSQIDFRQGVQPNGVFRKAHGALTIA